MHRAAAILLAAWLMPVIALAEGWQVYPYPEAGFAVQFPVPPVVQPGTYRSPAGESLPMISYTARQDGILYTLKIVDYSGTRADADATIAGTERTFGAAGKVTVAIDARINREYGRELSVTGNDGSRSAVAIFFVNRHLFLLVGESLPPNAIARSGDAVRFQQSLQFIGERRGFAGFGRFDGGSRGRFRGVRLQLPP